MVDRYDELYRGFRWQVPAQFNMAEACCGRHARDRHRFCLYWEDESGATSAWTYWDLQVSRRTGSRMRSPRSASSGATGSRSSCRSGRRR